MTSMVISATVARGLEGEALAPLFPASGVLRAAGLFVTGFATAFLAAAFGPKDLPHEKPGRGTVSSPESMIAT